MVEQLNVGDRRRCIGEVFVAQYESDLHLLVAVVLLDLVV